MKEYLDVETLYGRVCRVEVDVVAKRSEKNILIKGWNAYKELCLVENGNLCWVVKDEFDKIPEDWKDLISEVENAL